MARPRDPSIDRRIVEGCVALLDEVGRHRLSREQVARRAGVSLPALTRRFASVDEILLAIARTPPRPPAGSEDPADAPDLRAFLVASLTRAARAFAAGAVRRPAAELLAAAAGEPRIDEAFGATLGALRSDGLRRIRAAQEAGDLRADVDGETLLDLLAGAAYYRLLWRGEAVAVDEVEGIVDLLLLGAAPRRGGAPAPRAAGGATSEDPPPTSRGERASGRAGPP